MCFEDSLLGNKAGKSEGYQVDCIIEINLESHNLVQNIPHESTNGEPSTQRTIFNVNSRSIEIQFPFIHLFILMFFHNKRTSKARGWGGGWMHPSHPLFLRAYNVMLIFHELQKSGCGHKRKDTTEI